MDSLVIKPYFRGLNLMLSTPTANYSNTFSFSFLKFNCLSKFKRTSISVSLRSNKTPSKPLKPEPIGSKFDQPIKPFSPLVPILQRIKDLAAKASTPSWVYAFRGGVTEEDDNGDCYLQNGGFGMALLSLTTTAKIRISPFVATLSANPTFVSGLFAWAIAQSLKVVLNFFVERKWDLRIMFSSGGMPSSHTALCTALTTSVAICNGVADSLFPVCLGFTLIVMYDAIGVRRHAGMQAEVLNKIVEDLFQGHPISQRKLKELLGHTPSQVLAGAVLGIAAACVCCRGCLVAI